MAALSAYATPPFFIKSSPDELQTQIKTEQFAIDIGLRETFPGYRSDAGKVNVSAIKEYLGKELSDRYKINKQGEYVPKLSTVRVENEIPVDL